MYRTMHIITQHVHVLHKVVADHIAAYRKTTEKRLVQISQVRSSPRIFASLHGRRQHAPRSLPLSGTQEEEREEVKNLSSKGAR